MLEGKLFQPSILTLGLSANQLFSYSTGNRFDPPMVFATVNKCIALDVIAVVVSISLALLCIAIRRSTVQRTNVVLCNFTLSADEISGAGLGLIQVL